jgi:hypothetical protein
MVKMLISGVVRTVVIGWACYWAGSFLIQAVGDPIKLIDVVIYGGIAYLVYVLPFSRKDKLPAKSKPNRNIGRWLIGIAAVGVVLLVLSFLPDDYALRGDSNTQQSAAPAQKANLTLGNP